MELKDCKPQRLEDRKLIAYMLKHERFTHHDLAREVDVSDYRRTNLVSRLQRLNLIFEVGRENGRKVFTALNREAAAQFAANKRHTRIGSLWTAMRSMRIFTPDELLAICQDEWSSLTREDVQTYCTKLTKAGYFKVLEKAKSGGRPARYQLMQDSGPLPPQVRTLECIVDGNTDLVVYAAGNRV